MTDAVLVLAWLVLAHLIADFVIQTNSIAADKFTHGGRGWWGLTRHIAGVAVLVVPLPYAFGANGLVAAVVIVAAHAVVDRAKVVLTRRVEARALADAHRLHEPPAPEASLGTAWTPLPAALFVLDQAAHLLVIGWAWAAFIAGLDPVPAFAAGIDRLLGSWPREVVHEVALTGVVLVSLLIVNVRAGALLVATLVHPREALTGSDAAAVGAVNPPASWTVRVGPIVARADASATIAPEPPRLGSVAQVGATIGVLERLLIVTFVLTGAEAAIGFVIAAKTIARFRQLDDRAFAEYYLLGTLASVSVAIGSGLLAAAVLGLPR